MSDIYDYLLQPDFKDVSDDELQRIISCYDEVSSGITEGLRAMGSLAFWATANENYDADTARSDLRDMANLLMYLPRIAAAIRDNTNYAEYELRIRAKA